MKRQKEIDGAFAAARSVRFSGAPISKLELPLRIDAANLLDRMLRLEHQLKARRRSIGSRIIERIRRLAGSIAGRAAPASVRPVEELARCAKVLLKSGLFDPEYYLRRNRDVAAEGLDPVLHYLLHGATEQRSPSPYFSTRWYVQRYPDVAASGKNPLYHFIMSGYAEGRMPLPRNPSAFAATDPESDHGGARPAFGPVAATRASPVDVLRAEAPSGIASASQPRHRLVVYTALFGNYDDLFLPSPEQAQDCDFVVFTDQPNVPPPWRRGDVSYTAPSGAKQNRFYKLLPHRFFPRHEWSLYLDANIDLEMNPHAFLERYRSIGPDCFVFRHPTRTSILQELAACIAAEKDDAERMVRQVAHYLDAGFRQAFPLTENNVLLRRHGDPELADLGEAWWEEVRSRSNRDQLSLSYAVERKNYLKIAVFEDGRLSARNCPGFRLRAHRHQFRPRHALEDQLA